MIALLAAAVIATASAPPHHDPVIAAAGDIACDTRPHQAILGPDIESILGGCSAAATAALLTRLAPTAVLPLGDEQYQNGEIDAFRQSYAHTWGKFKAITHPVPGNHEYYTSPAAQGYFDYFGAAAGPRGKGYYSYDLGAWHLVALNGNCEAVGGCAAGSVQERWLVADLAQHRSACTLAYWHQPRFSSGTHHNDTAYADFWADLYRAGADVVFAGHDHDYERFAPQTPGGAADASHGIREFVVGTGGRSHSIFLKIEKNSEARAASTFGILTLTLRLDSYEWRFLPIAGYAFTDRGQQRCHGRN